MFGIAHSFEFSFQAYSTVAGNSQGGHFFPSSHVEVPLTLVVAVSHAFFVIYVQLGGTPYTVIVHAPKGPIGGFLLSAAVRLLMKTVPTAAIQINKILYFILVSMVTLTCYVTAIIEEKILLHILFLLIDSSATFNFNYHSNEHNTLSHYRGVKIFKKWRRATSDAHRHEPRAVAS